LQHGQTITQSETDKYITAKKRLLDFFVAIAPTPVTRPERKITGDTLFFEPGIDFFFVVIPGLQCIPVRLNVKLVILVFA
jgi:hypothetical protein